MNKPKSKSKRQPTQTRYTLDWTPFRIPVDGRLLIPDFTQPGNRWTVCVERSIPAQLFKQRVEGCYGGADYVRSILTQRGWMMNEARNRANARAEIEG